VTRNRIEWAESLAQDVRYAARTLWNSPLFTIVAVLTLAIGTGATTAIFSSVNAMLLRPLPFAHPEQLISVRTRFPDGRVTSGMVSPIELGALNDPHMPVVRAAGVSANPFEMTIIRDDGTPAEMLISGVTEGFFEILGLPVTLGRGFTHEDFIPSGPNAPITLIISHRMWTEMFGRDPAIAGKAVRLIELPTGVTIAGVAAPDLDFPRGTDFWLAMRVNPREIGHSFAGVLRVRPGTGIAALRNAAAAAIQNLGRTSQIDAGREYVLQPLLDSIVGDLRPTLLIVLGATALLLLLACVNVMDLLLARGASRTRELAMRAAVGASRGRLIRQMLTESLVLACAGAVFGIGLAYVGVRVLLAMGASKLPRLSAVPFNGGVLLFALGVLVFTALVMGIVPAWRLARVDIRTLLNESDRSATPGRASSRSMSTLIVGEIALAIMLAAGAGWLVQSFARLQSVDPGFTANGRLVVDVKATRRFSDPAQAHAWWDTMLKHVREVPGVAAGSGNTFPLRADRDGANVVGIQGEVFDPNRLGGAHERTVTPDFFKAMGVRLLAGRDFTAYDRQDTTPAAIVNQSFVHTFLRNRDPLGVQFTFGLPQPDAKNAHTIVGVVDDIRYGSLAAAPDAAYYLSETQNRYVSLQQPVVVLARSGDPHALAASIRSALAVFYPQIAMTVSDAPDIVAATLSRQRLGMTLMLIFGGLALVLAAIGIYGVIAYASAQRRPELATRIALGASAGQVFWLVMSSGQRLALIGILLGLAGAYAVGRIVAGSVYAMRAFDPVILITAAAVVAAITFFAAVIPAILASRMDPVRALRSE
jgi:putative ABC transport system permease protein